ncbi:hypothetical protein P5673_004122 [Acropora cervicornis]|uniref:DUF5641 domain-containing protein n=1 Tax=Acropora cervicornis TaxID=6130 RepID=A0AAD9VEG8_ACRCE|nr:hypothetical protein P5673_004122 [Acropora cervicornis]
MAAVLGLRLARKMSELLQTPFSNCTLWTDSKDVIFWIQGQSRRYKTFVANRVSEIHQKSSPRQDDIAFNPRNRWRLIQNLVKLFWKRWREEFLSTLNTRKKWRAAKDNLKVGDCSILVQRPNAFTEHKTFFNHRKTRTRGLMPLTAHCVCVTQDAYTTGM